MIRKALLALAFGLAASCVYAQTAPSPADVGVSKGTPDVFKLKGHDNVWTPFGSVDPSTHIYVPGTNGNIAPNDCVKWGPGLTSAGAACNSVTGGAHPANQLTIYTSHSGLLANVTTPTEAWTVVQQGFYASGDGGAATYDWNFTSFCVDATSGADPRAVGDGFICILPSGQSQNTAGRYLLRTTNGAFNVLQLGFKDDGTDNGPLVDRLNSVLGGFNGVAYLGSVPVVFPANPTNVQSNYWFDRPLTITHGAGITCGDGSRTAVFPRVNLIFGPGTGGVLVPGIGASLDGFGVDQFNFRGCGVVETGRGPTTFVTGNTTIDNAALGPRHEAIYGAQQAVPLFSVGDGIVAFPGGVSWFFSGYIVNDVLTVTAFSGGYSATDPGIAVGQMLQGLPVNGLYIKATHAEDPTYTGTGQLGTYQLNAPLTAPPVALQAIPSGLYGSAGSPVGLQTQVMTGPPAVPMGTTVTGCSTLSGALCASATGTLTLSNPATIGTIGFMWDLPGPNTTTASGDQSFTVTTSSKGNVYGPITAGIDGSTMTVTGGAGNLKLGDIVIGGGGGLVSPTTTASLTIGQLTGIPVSSCAGIVSGNEVVAFSGGNSVFPPGTTVADCTGTALSINPQIAPYGVFLTVSGSSVVQASSTYYFQAFGMWKGQPVTGPGIPANTVVQSWRFTPYFAGGVDITLSNAATTTTTSTPVTLSFGGAVFAAPSGTAINAMTAWGEYIAAFGTGTGGNGTYTLDGGGFSLAPGSTVFAYDTPGMIHVSGGPRVPLPQELLWLDGVPFGTLAAKMFGTLPSNMTIVTSDTGSYHEVPIFADHPSGSGKMWILPSGLLVGTSHDTYGNTIDGFSGAGLSIACASNNYRPAEGCGRSKDSDNTILYNAVGRLVVGNNGGGSASTFNEYDHNDVADVVDLLTVGETYIGEMLQGEDEGSNSHNLVVNCNAGSVFTGIYASGSSYEATCVAPQNAMLSSQTLYAGPFVAPSWFGPLYGGPFDIGVVTGVPQPQQDCSGAPTSSFKVQAGIVTHC